MPDFFAVQTALGITVVGRRRQSVLQRRPVRMRFRIGLVGDFFLQSLTLAKVVEADVGCDPVNPRVKTGSDSNPVFTPIGLEEGLLENFSRLFAISQHVER